MAKAAKSLPAQPQHRLRLMLLAKREAMIVVASVAVDAASLVVTVPVDPGSGRATSGDATTVVADGCLPLTRAAATASVAHVPVHDVLMAVPRSTRAQTN